MSRTNGSKSSRFEAGFGREIITPARGIPLAGYFNPRPNRGVLDHLYAKAVLLRQGEKVAGIVSCDLLLLTRELVNRARAALARAGMPFADRLLFCATHTHTGPYTSALFEHEPCQKYLDFLVRRLVSVVQMAQANLAPAELRVGRVRRNPFAFNRRYVMRDGRVVTNPGKLNPDIVRPEGVVDREIGIFSIFQDGRLAGILANITNHTDTIGLDLVSADWPGQMEKHIQEQLGYDAQVITLIAPSGNVNHFDVKSQRGQTCYDEAKRIGKGYGEIILRALKRLEPVRSGPLTAQAGDVEIRYRRITEEELTQARAILKKPSTATKGDLTSEGLAKGDIGIEKMFARELIQFHRQCDGQRLPFRLTAIKIGEEIGIVSLPGEPFTEIGLAIKAASPFRHTFVVSVANGCCGYVPMKECFKRGGYEILPVIGGGVVPETAEQLIAAAIALLNAR